MSMDYLICFQEHQILNTIVNSLILEAKITVMNQSMNLTLLGDLFSLNWSYH